MRIGKKIKTEQDRAKELAKERKKRRKHLIKTKYGHKALKHSRKGKLSCVFAGIGIGLWILLVLIAFLKNGEAGILVGLAGFGIGGFNVYGLRLAYLGFRERNRQYLTCKVGLGLNGGLLLLLLGIFVRGLLT